MYPYYTPLASIPDTVCCQNAGSDKPDSVMLPPPSSLTPVVLNVVSPVESHFNDMRPMNKTFRFETHSTIISLIRYLFVPISSS